MTESTTSTRQDQSNKHADSQPPRQRRLTALAARLSLAKFSGVYLLLVLITFFSLTEPQFRTAENFRVLAVSQAIAGVLTIALMVSLVSGAFDLSVAANMSLAISLVGWLQTQIHLNALLAVVLTLVAGAAVGAMNALIITVLHVDSIVATLGMSAILEAVAFMLVGGQTLIYGISPTFDKFGQDHPLSIPVPVFYFAGVAVLVWFLVEQTTWGRYLRAAGANTEATRLAGVNVVSLQWTSLLLSGTLAAFSGIILTMQLGASSFGAGDPYLLPAFSAVFLGATQIRPGRFNVAGTVVALYLVATGVKGLQLKYPGVAWIADLIEGVTLIGSVALSSYAIKRARRRGSG